MINYIKKMGKFKNNPIFNREPSNDLPAVPNKISKKYNKDYRKKRK